MPRILWFFRFAAVALLTVFLLLTLCILFFSHKILTVDSGEVKADAIVVLGGGWAERSTRATELFRKGDAPKIVVSGIGDCDFVAQQLENGGVPAAIITKEDRSTSTLENAKFSVPLLRQMGARGVIIVTSWYHSRRALACFRHFAPEIRFYSRPSYGGLSSGGSYRGDCVLSFREFIKLLGYGIFYGVSPCDLKK